MGIEELVFHLIQYLSIKPVFTETKIVAPIKISRYSYGIYIPKQVVFKNNKPEHLVRSILAIDNNPVVVVAPLSTVRYIENEIMSKRRAEKECTEKCAAKCSKRFPELRFVCIELCTDMCAEE